MDSAVLPTQSGRRLLVPRARHLMREGREKARRPDAAPLFAAVHMHSRLQDSAHNPRDEQRRRRADESASHPTIYALVALAIWFLRNP